MTDRIQPLVTIAIPTYNRAEKFLRNAISCALNQTYRRLEIIISNNCSTDNTEEVVREFADPRIRYFRQEKNIGANNNFNFCINQATGKYFMLLLDDDIIDVDFIETCINETDENTEVGLIRTGTRLIDKQGNVLLERPNPSAGLSTTELFLTWFDNKTTFYVCSTLFNTEKLKKIGGFRSKHCLFQDVMTEAKLIAKFGRIDIYAPKASFRKHEENMGIGAKVSAWCEDSLELLEILCELLPHDQALIREKGKPFLCRMNYNRADGISSPIRRSLTYLKVAHMFEHNYPLSRFIYRHNIRPHLRAIKRKLKNLLPGNNNHAR